MSPNPSKQSTSDDPAEPGADALAPPLTWAADVEALARAWPDLDGTARVAILRLAGVTT